MKVMAILLSLLILTLSGAAEDASTLTVTGVGEVVVPADTVFVSVSFTAEDDNITLASINSSEGLNRTIEALIDAGVKRDEVQSGRGRSVQQIQTCSRVCNNSTCVMVANKAVGRVTEQVTIRFDAEDKTLIDSFLEAARTEGAEAEISGYALVDEGQALAEARRKAVLAADENAKNLASAAGLVLGKRLEMFEPSYPAVSQQSIRLDPWDLGMVEFFDFSWPDMFGPFDTGVSAEPGMMEVRSKVVATYEVYS